MVDLIWIIPDEAELDVGLEAMSATTISLRITDKKTRDTWRVNATKTHFRLIAKAIMGTVYMDFADVIPNVPVKDRHAIEINDNDSDLIEF